MGKRASIHYDALVGSIYDAALDVSLWPSLLASAAVHFGASHAAFYTPERVPEDGGFFFSHNVPPDHIQQYAARYQFIDPWVHGHHSKFGDKPGGFLGDMLVPASELQKTEFYADHLRPLDINQLCTAAIGAASGGGELISFAMFRGRRARDFGEDERRLSERIALHMQRAFLISSRLRSAEGGAFEAMLDVVRAPVVLVDATARIVQLSSAAAKLLEEGIWLRASLNRLHAVTDDAKLRKTIYDIATSGEQGPFSRVVRLAHPRLGCTLHVLVARAGWRFPGKAFVALGAAASSPENLDRRLAEVYGLTPAEVRLCQRLGEGRSLGAMVESW